MLKIYIKYPNIAKKLNMHKICQYIDFNMHILDMQNMQNASNDLYMEYAYAE